MRVASAPCRPTCATRTTQGAKQLGHGTSYLYAHDQPHAVAAQQYLPDELVGTRYYEPSDRGYERQVTERLDRIRAILDEQG